MQRRTSEDWRELIQSWQASNLAQKQFCAQQVELQGNEPGREESENELNITRKPCSFEEILKVLFCLPHINLIGFQPGIITLSELSKPTSPSEQ